MGASVPAYIFKSGLVFGNLVSQLSQYLFLDFSRN